jgi:cell division protein FtsN
MARDYAKTRSRRTQSEQESPSRFSTGLLWLCIGIILGLLIPSFSYIKQHVTRIVHGGKQTNDTLLRDPIPQKIKPEPAEQPQQQPKENIKEEKVDFDFYTILPNSEKMKPPERKAVQKTVKPKTVEPVLPVPEIKTTPTAAAPAPVSSLTSPPQPKSIEKSVTGYLLQLGSFKTQAEADQLRAQLTLVGLDANIKRSVNNNITRYRVWIGTYPTIEAAVKEQQRLATRNVKSSLAKVK